MKRKFGSKRGLTLLEVVLSLVILMIIIVPVLTMVLSSVRTNKESEDKLKANAIAQQYIENIKSSGSINEGTVTTEKDGFTISQTIAPESDFKFEVPEEDKTYEDIKYHAKIQIDESNNLIVFGSDGSFKYNQENNLSGENTIKIVNNEGSIDIESENSSWKVNIHKADTEEKEGNILFELIGNHNEADECDIVLNLKAENKSNVEYLNLYFAKPPRTDGEAGYYEYPKYSVENTFGKVKSISNITINKETYNSTSRLYRVDITVEKKGKVLQQITAYKTF